MNVRLCLTKVAPIKLGWCSLEMTSEADSPTGMNLDDYVRATLLAIMRGVVDAQKDQEVGGHVGRSPAGTQGLSVSNDGHGNTVSMVEFDVATTVEETSGAEGGVGIKVVSLFNAKAGGRTEVSSSGVSRVTFRVPISIPRPGEQKADDEAERARRDARNRRTSEALRSHGRRTV
jgi:hypothetical protein